MTSENLIWASCVCVDGAAVLLRGPSGSGKSDLALRLLDGGAELISDDQTLVQKTGEKLMAQAPPTISGMLEVRGIGLVSGLPAKIAPVKALFDMVSREEKGKKIERLPERTTENIAGVEIPLFLIDPFESSAAAKVRMALKVIVEGRLDVD